MQTLGSAAAASSGASAVREDVSAARRATTTPAKKKPTISTDTVESEAPATKSPTASTSERQSTNRPTAQNLAAPTNDQAQTTSTSARQSYVNVDADLSACRQAQSKAQQCCGPSGACLSGQDRANYAQLMSGGGADGEDGLTDACVRYERATALAGQLNGKVAALCTNNQYACTNTCGSLVSKYQNLINSCGDDCDNHSTYQDALATLQAQQMTCASLSAQSEALSIQAVSSGSDQGMAAACQARAGSSSGYDQASMPSSSVESTQASALGDPAGYAAAATAAAPTPVQYASVDAPMARLSDGAAGEGLGPSVAYGGDVGSGGVYYGQSLPGREGAGATPGVRPVPNGAGGFAGGGGSGGSLAPGAPNRPSPGDPGFSADIERGLRSGGYSQPSGGEAADEAGGGGYYQGGTRAPANAASGYEGLDLKQYLPGGAHYRSAGAADRRSEINVKEDDLFRRISAKYIEKCKLGVLWRCQE